MSKVAFVTPLRKGEQPRDERARAHVISRTLRADGIATLCLPGDAARAGWARDIPGPVAADLLGITFSTATQWASRTRRDWTDYIAERAHCSEMTADAGNEEPNTAPCQYRANTEPIQRGDQSP